FQAEDGIRDATVTGVQTCALPILNSAARSGDLARLGLSAFSSHCCSRGEGFRSSFSFSTKWEKAGFGLPLPRVTSSMGGPTPGKIGRASCRERVEVLVRWSSVG